LSYEILYGKAVVSPSVIKLLLLCNEPDGYAFTLLKKALLLLLKINDEAIDIIISIFYSTFGKSRAKLLAPPF
jgi:hypothetical protein